MTYLLIIMLVPSPIPSQIPHALFDIISLGADAVEHHAQDICTTVHTCAHSKMPKHNIVNSIRHSINVKSSQKHFIVDSNLYWDGIYITRSVLLHIHEINTHQFNNS